MSGATKFLAEKGIIADYALEMDPRESQLIVSLPPVPGTIYIVASCVCEAFFDELKKAGNDIILWHTVNTNWEDELQFIATVDPHKRLCLHAGSTVGLSSIHIGGVMGYSRFEIHGMDGSFSEDGLRHAAFHGGKEQHPKITWDAGNKTYRTSQIMANAVAESINTAKNFPIITIWHGSGLTQALIRESDLPNACCADEIEKRSHLNLLRPRVVKMPSIPVAEKHTYWDTLLQFLTPHDLPELVNNISICEPRRTSAQYNTGSIPFESSVYLRALSRFYTPRVVAEIGTFIGTSTLALNPQRVIYTCDRSNDCVPALYDNDRPNIITHPYQSSTEMLRNIQEKVDMFFFDGRIQPADIPEIVRLSHDDTVFVFDDCVGNEKGVVNMKLLSSSIQMKRLAILPIPNSPSTLAALLPFGQQAPPQ
jgi:hypothetical protein